MEKDKEEKKRNLNTVEHSTNILYMMFESFSHDDVLDSCVIWRNETNLEKARCLYLDSHEDSWLN